MPVKPTDSYLELTCQDCDWRKTIRLRGDVLVCPPTCPSCGSENFSVSTTRSMRALLTDPVGYLSSLIKGR